ncbi:MAG: DsbA family protein [Pyrinomonadaceae bacterium]
MENSAPGGAATTVTLALPVSERDHSSGPADAPVTLVEYGDYECPFCARAQPVVKEIRRQMGDRLRFVFRHFP